MTTIPETAPATSPAILSRRPVRAKRAKTAEEETRDRGILSVFDWHKRSTRIVMGFVHVFLSGGLVFAGLGPILWLAKAAFTTTQDTISTPLLFFPSGPSLDSIIRAWTEIHVDQYFLNTVILAAGSWFVQLLVATTAGFALSVLRPRYGFIINGLVLATLFIPSIVLLVPLYLTILHPPLIGVSLLNNYLAVWLPAGANAFNILLVKRFFDNLPHEVFEAARTDGAGSLRLFWSIAMPMSRPILGVVSVFAIIASWKDFLWPLLVLPKPAIQPLSVRIPSMAGTIEVDVLLASLAISTIIPIVLFLLFQGVFLKSAGLGGAVKG
jgi:multiple sugar transport system permease protein